jgi:hypothetical protein
MAAMMIVGFVLFAIGLGGAFNACQADANDRDVVTAAMSGLAFALGLGLLAIGAGKRGYHRRPVGAPPGDMDPDKATTDPPPDDPRKGVIR